MSELAATLLKQIHAAAGERNSARSFLFPCNQRASAGGQISADPRPAGLYVPRINRIPSLAPGTPINTRALSPEEKPGKRLERARIVLFRGASMHPWGRASERAPRNWKVPIAGESPESFQFSTVDLEFREVGIFWGIERCGIVEFGCESVMTIRTRRGSLERSRN